MLSGVSRSKYFPGWGHATFHKASLSFFRSHDVICFPLSLSKYLLPPATKLGQGYVFTGVCDSVHRGGVCLSACWDTHTPWEQTALPQGADTPQEQTPPWSKPPRADTPPSMLGDTINARAVRILLEYNLVWNNISQYQ